MPDRTHIEVKSPEIDARHLADYMAASERKKRSILIGCKYRPIAKLLQHKEAKVVVAGALRRGEKNPRVLKERAELIRAKLATDDFDALTNEANADYVKKFSEVVEEIELLATEIFPGKVFPRVPVEGVQIRFSPNLLLRRLTKTNKLKIGALMLRYAKGRALPVENGDYQSALIFGLIGEVREDDAAEPEKGLCLTLDVVTGILYPAPGKAVTMWANTKAACMTIAEHWPNLPPPPKAIF